MTNPVSSELIDGIISQREEFRRISMKNILDRLSEDYDIPVCSFVAPNPTSVPDAPSDCLEAMGEKLEDYDIEEVNRALDARYKEKEEKEKQIREQERLNRPHATNYITFTAKDIGLEDNPGFIDIDGVTMSDGNNYVNVNMELDSSVGIRFNTKEQLDNFILHLQKASSVFN